MSMVVGIDLSLTATGVAGIFPSDEDESNPYGEHYTQTVLSKGKRADTIRQRRDRINGIADEVVGIAGGADLALIENAFAGTPGGSLIDRCGLLHKVIDGLLERHTPVVLVVTQHLKMFTTGSGAAKKAAVTLGVSKMWPSWSPSSPKFAEDEADALGIASIGAAMTAIRDHCTGQLPFGITQDYRQRALTKVRENARKEGLDL